MAQAGRHMAKGSQTVRTDGADSRAPVASGGAPLQGSASRRVALCFLVAGMLLLALPFLLLGVAGGASQGEKRELAPWPSLANEDGSPNLRLLSEAGAWFDDHFALRSELIDLDATIRERIFMTSSTPNVVVGREGWLFYAGTLDDYRRSAPLSERALDNIACNLALIEEQVRAQGKGFAFTIAPNKNTLYPELMPYYELKGAGESNLERLRPLLEQRGISYVDLEQCLGASDERLYLARDSHWTNKGALLGYQALMEALGRDGLALDAALPDGTDEHVGDIEQMLHPVSVGTERQGLWESSRSFSYANDAASVEDPTIETRSAREGASGRLMCYRDSFGNALLPYLASTYAEANFSKMVPYDMGSAALAAADDVIIERAERHLSFFNSDPPYLAAPERDAPLATETVPGGATLVARENGPYLEVEGSLDESVADDGAAILISLFLYDGTAYTFEAFHVGPASDGTADSEGQDGQSAAVTTDWGYRAYVLKSSLAGRVPAHAKVTVMHGGAPTEVLSQDIVLGG